MSIYPPTGTLEIKNATLKIPVVDLQYTSNTAKLEANSNVVTEFSRSKKLIKYPRVALTSAAQSSAGDYEGYIVNQSSVYTSESDHGAYLAFRGNSHWLSSSNSFDGAPDRFNDVNGPWISIQLPTKIKLEYLEFSAASNRIAQLITAGSVYASNNGSTWINIGSLDNLGTYTNTAPAHVNFTHTTLYDRYLLHVTANTTSYNYVHMEKLSLFGIPEYDPEAHGTDVTVKSVANVPNTDWLEVYYDAKDLATEAVTTVNDLKPSSLGSALNSSSTNNITVADDAFVFNGTDSYIKINDLTNPLGAWVHSVAAWVKFTDFDSAQDLSWIGDANTVAATRQSFSFQTGGEAVTMGINGSNVQFRFTSPLTAGKWHHVVYTYNGGSAGSASTAYQVFIDNVEASKIGGVGTGTLTLPADSALWIGTTYNTSNYFGGSIANFRLFNRALTSDEIYQLYAYQKEDFGHGDLSMTLKAGRLGIGTSEPRVALDVRGEIRAVGSMLYLLDTPLTHEWHWSGSTSSTGSEHQVHYHQFPPNCRAIYADVFLPRASANDHGTHILGESWKNIGRTWTDGRSLTTATTNNARPSTYMTTGVTQGAKVVYIGQPGQSDNFEYYYGNWWQSLIIPLGDGNNLYHGRTGYGGTHGWIYVYTKGYYV